jgi:DNA mismatch endonuclease (patch repair protein)
MKYAPTVLRIGDYSPFSVSLRGQTISTVADIMSKEERSARMSLIHSASTKPELRLRHALWNLGFRYRVNDSRLPGSPDIVFPKYRTAIFIHGCFWHGHLNCKVSHIPKTNTNFWTAKVARNQERDQEVWRQLEAKGWSVLIVWECELKKAALEDTVFSVAQEIVRNGESYRNTLEERKHARNEYQKERKKRMEREQSLLKEAKSKFDFSLSILSGKNDAISGPIL